MVIYNLTKKVLIVFIFFLFLPFNEVISQNKNPENFVKWYNIKARDDVMIEFRETNSENKDPDLPVIIHFQGSGYSSLVDPLVDSIHFRMSDLGYSVIGYNKRGIYVDKNDRSKENVDHSIYSKAGFWQNLSDAEDIFEHISSKGKCVICFGQSEGVILSAYLYEKYPEVVKGIFGIGTPMKSLGIIAEYQMTEGVVETFMENFDSNKDEKLDKLEIEKIPEAYTKLLFFKPLSDYITEETGYLDADKIIKLRKDHFYEQLQKRNDEWFLQIGKEPAQFVLDAYEVEALEQKLLRLKCPIFIFHGEKDKNSPLKYLLDFKERLKFLERPNIKIYIQSGVGHALDINREKPFWNKLFEELGEFKTRAKL